MPAQPVEPPSLDVYKREAEQSVARTGAIGADHRYLGQIDVDPNLVIYRHNERARERAAVASLQGAVWTLDLVAARIVEAFRCCGCRNSTGLAGMAQRCRSR
jgi:hypothetical protein